MQKVWVIVASVVFVLLVGLQWLLYRTHTLESEAEEYKRTIRELNRAVAASDALAKASQKSLDSLKVSYDALEKQKGVRYVTVQKAVEAAPDWSRQSVPPSVVDALRVQYNTDGN